jgi:hypothetical protein
MMTLQEALAEVKQNAPWIENEFALDEIGFKLSIRDAIAATLNAAASGNLIPKADHDQAIALVVKRAGEAVKLIADRYRSQMAGTTLADASYRLAEAEAADKFAAAILALAPADALAEVQKLQAKAAEYDDAFANGVIHGQNALRQMEGQTFEVVDSPEVQALRAERDVLLKTVNAMTAQALELMTAKEAAEAEVARLTGYLRQIESLTVHSGGEIHGVHPNAWRDAFTEAQETARAALKGPTPRFTEWPEEDFDITVGKRKDTP